jgi:DNA-binding HxlR family transcriptional regulator
MATRTSTGERTYGQWCPIAAGLDVLGDRWVLLILRELLMSDCRFTDLRAALPGLAPNLLTERLRALQAEGLVETVELPPPAARTVYRATAAGRGVAPVLSALARFGAAHLEGDPSPTFDAQRALHSLVAPWRRRVEAHLRVRLVLQRADGTADSADLVLDGLRTTVAAPEGAADVTITTDAAALARARRLDSPGLDAVVTGKAADRRLALDLFRLHVTHRT